MKEGRSDVSYERDAAAKMELDAIRLALKCGKATASRRDEIELVNG